MKILFLTLLKMEDISDHNIYCDLLRFFRDKGHDIYIVSPNEARTKKITEYQFVDGVHILHVKTGNITQSKNLIEKGLSTITIESLYINAIKRYLSHVKFDLVLYSTPPITFYKSIEFIKKRDQAQTYLLLKDIFPQNALDLGMLQNNGIKGLIYNYFRNKEKKLYSISDKIGCMSTANVNYILKHNPEIKSDKVEICPNSIEVIDKSLDKETRIKIRHKYNIPHDKIVLIYGGNLGKPQGIPFILKCLEVEKHNKDVYFLIVGNGTEFKKIESYQKETNQSNLKIIHHLPKDEYDLIVGSSDVGLIFLDHCFTIPNFPSRLLNYMQVKIPVLALSDCSSDIGKTIVDGDFGWWCESNNVTQFDALIHKISKTKLHTGSKEDAEFDYLKQNFNVKNSYEVIMNSMNL